jgi:hypothetical protein
MRRNHKKSEDNRLGDRRRFDHARHSLPPLYCAANLRAVLFPAMLDRKRSG